MILRVSPHFLLEVRPNAGAPSITPALVCVTQLRLRHESCHHFSTLVCRSTGLSYACEHSQNTTKTSFCILSLKNVFQSPILLNMYLLQNTKITDNLFLSGGTLFLGGEGC